MFWGGFCIGNKIFFAYHRYFFLWRKSKLIFSISFIALIVLCLIFIKGALNTWIRRRIMMKSFCDEELTNRGLCTPLFPALKRFTSTCVKCFSHFYAWRCRIILLSGDVARKGFLRKDQQQQHLAHEGKVHKKSEKIGNGAENVAFIERLFEGLKNQVFFFSLYFSNKNVFCLWSSTFLRREWLWDRLLSIWMPSCAFYLTKDSSFLWSLAFAVVVVWWQIQGRISASFWTQPQQVP